MFRCVEWCRCHTFGAPCAKRHVQVSRQNVNNKPKTTHSHSYSYCRFHEQCRRGARAREREWINRNEMKATNRFTSFQALSLFFSFRTKINSQYYYQRANRWTNNSNTRSPMCPLVLCVHFHLSDEFSDTETTHSHACGTCYIDVDRYGRRSVILSMAKIISKMVWWRHAK